MRYTIKMLGAFLVGRFMVVESPRLASESKWVSVSVHAALVFLVFTYMAYSSVVAEREAGKQ